jgi:hypothetical protein
MSALMAGFTLTALATIDDCRVDQSASSDIGRRTSVLSSSRRKNASVQTAEVFGTAKIATPNNSKTQLA